jgi:hypothetical protein
MSRNDDDLTPGELLYFLAMHAILSVSVMAVVASIYRAW